jgi:CheY-like chemotaxis protein
MIDNDLKFLIVEDDLISMKILKLIIKKDFRNSQIYYAKNGEIGVDIYKKYNSNFIFMDIHMPQMDGITCIEKIREFEKDNNLKKSYIVVYTSTDIKIFKNNNIIKTYMIDDFIVKPVTPEKIKEIINKFIEGE